MPPTELQQVLAAVSYGSTALQHVARAQGFESRVKVPPLFFTQAVLSPLRQLQALMGAPVPSRRKPAIRARRPSRSGLAKSGIPKPVDLGGLDQRLPKVQDNRNVRGRPDPTLEASNCRALLLEVIRRAAYDWVLYRGSSKLPKRLLAESAYQWLFVEEPSVATYAIRSKHGKELTAFVVICGQLDIDPERVRGTIRAMTERDIMGAGRPAERRKSKTGEDIVHGDDLRVFDVDVDSLPVFDCMFAPEPRS